MIKSRELLVKKALQHIPHVLGLVDKNKLSPTYGCFDRNYWHYRTVDFPTGMAQLGVIILAHVYTTQYPNNPYYQQERIKELIIAGIDYLPHCSHKDGTADEFYPYERALGATTFSLIAALEAYMMLEEKIERQEQFFKKRADWLLNNTEPNIIANHQASVALALALMHQLTGEQKYQEGAKKRIAELHQWWHNEGWFYEYEGCDPGYSTFTITFLAKYWKLTQDETVLPYLEKLINFCKYFIGPDGSYAGEYGSRNTSHFYPLGFEIMGKKYPVGLKIVDKYMQGLAKNKQEHMNDEKYFFYNVINYLETHAAWNTKRPGAYEHKKDFEKYFPGAKMYIAKKGVYYAIISLAKGGVTKLFKGKKLLHTSTGIIMQTKEGTNMVTQIIDGYAIQAGDGVAVVTGHFNKVKFELPTPFKMILFRAGLLSLAWSWKIGSIVKDVLVKRLITGKKKQAHTFERNFTFTSKGLEIKTTLQLQNNDEIVQLHSTTDLAVITVPTSKYFQESHLSSWTNLNKHLPDFNQHKKIVITERIA
jgi:hypothetical protein